MRKRLPHRRRGTFRVGDAEDRMSCRFHQYLREKSPRVAARALPVRDACRGAARTLLLAELRLLVIVLLLVLPRRIRSAWRETPVFEKMFSRRVSAVVPATRRALAVSAS